jgi:membrane-associated phospholipid phosphatase
VIFGVTSGSADTVDAPFLFCLVRKHATVPAVPFLTDLLVALVAGSLAFLAARWYSGSEAVPDQPAREVARAVGSAVRPSRGLRRLVTARLDRSVATGLLLTLALGATLLGGIVLGVLAVLIRRVASIQHVDNYVADWGYRHRSAGSTSALHVVTNLGNIRLVVVLALALVLAELVRRRSRWALLFVLAVLGGEEAAALAVKALVGRVRPTLTTEAATLGPSFPSGHSATAAAFYAAAALVLGRTLGRRARHLLIAGAVAVTAAVAASRVLLDLHWLSDVVGGVALGWAWFALCAVAFGGRLLAPTAAVDIAAAEAAAPQRTSVGAAVRER